MCNCNFSENSPCCNQQEDEIEEFEIFKEYPINTFFRLNNYIFKVVSDLGSTCRECDYSGAGVSKDCALMLCSEVEREDCTPVKFILYDTIPENE